MCINENEQATDLLSSVNLIQEWLICPLAVMICIQALHVLIFALDCVLELYIFSIPSLVVRL